MATERKTTPTQTVGVTEFKARCLELLAGVGTRGDRILITKRGKPIATVSPVESEVRPLKGRLAGKITFVGDIVNADWTDDWEAAR